MKVWKHDFDLLTENYGNGQIMAMDKLYCLIENLLWVYTFVLVMELSINLDPTTFV